MRICFGGDQHLNCEHLKQGRWFRGKTNFIKLCNLKGKFKSVICCLHPNFAPHNRFKNKKSRNLCENLSYIPTMSRVNPANESESKW